MEESQLIENANSMALGVNTSLEDNNLKNLKNEISLKENEIACNQVIIEEVVQSSKNTAISTCETISASGDHDTLMVSEKRQVVASIKLWRQKIFRKVAKEKRRENISKIKQGFKSFLAHSFSTAGLCSFTLFYSFAGAFLIGLIDHDIQGIRSVTNKVEKERVSLSNQFWSHIIQYNIFKEEAFKQDAIKILEDYEKFLFDMIKQNHYDETFKAISENTLDEWPIPEGLFFAMTVITTIGYGKKAPKTWQGRLFTIAYALIGIPMMLLCISNLGNIMANTFRFSYRKICCCCCLNNNYPLDRRVTTSLIEEKIEMETQDDNGGEKNKLNRKKKFGMTNSNSYSYNPNSTSLRRVKSQYLNASSRSKSISEFKNRLDDRNSVPIWLVFTLMLSYVFIGGYFFSLMKDNSIPNIFVGSYFCFITLSTIGFGDIVPGMLTNPEYKNGGDSYEINYELIICCAYLFFGLALIAMSFNLVQEKIKRKFIRIGRRIGVIAHPESV